MLDFAKIKNAQTLQASLAELALPLVNIQADKVYPQNVHTHGYTKGYTQATWDILRLDIIHPVASGNKLFKLLPYLLLAEQQQYQSLVSFGGRFSNHLHALAFVGKALGFKTYGFVRGYAEQALTPSLLDAKRWGMQLTFIGNTEYRARSEAEHWHSYLQDLAEPLLIGEGGAFLASPLFCAEQFAQVNQQAQATLSALIANSLAYADRTIADYDVISLPVGTGSFAKLLDDALCQLLQGESEALVPPAHLRLLLICALCNQKTIEQGIVSKLCLDAQAVSGFECGGFAKFDKALAELIKRYYIDYDLLLDPTYNAKQIWAIESLKNQTVISPDQSVLSVHTGGLQSFRGMLGKMQNLIEMPVDLQQELANMAYCYE